MAGISTKGMYGLAAMHYLYQTTDTNPIQISTISEFANIPQNYLEQILLGLRKKGFLSSIRGAKGGYILTDYGKESTILEILEALEGPMCSLDCKTKNSTLSFFWEDSVDKIRKIFNVKLKDLQEIENKMQVNLNYII